MSKVLIDLEIPSIGEHHDVFLPLDVKVSDIISLLSGSVNDLVVSEYVASGQEFLCYKEKNIIFDMDRNLESYGVKNGDHLTLI